MQISASACVRRPAAGGDGFVTPWRVLGRRVAVRRRRTGPTSASTAWRPGSGPESRAHLQDGGVKLWRGPARSPLPPHPGGSLTRARGLINQEQLRLQRVNGDRVYARLSSQNSGGETDPCVCVRATGRVHTRTCARQVRYESYFCSASGVKWLSNWIRTNVMNPHMQNRRQSDDQI